MPARTPREDGQSALRHSEAEAGNRYSPGNSGYWKSRPELFEKAVEEWRKKRCTIVAPPPIPHRRLRKILSVFIANLSEICVVPSIESLKRSPAVPKNLQRMRGKNFGIREFSNKFAEATKNMSPAERAALLKMFEGVSSEITKSDAPSTCRVCPPSTDGSTPTV